MIRLDDDPPSIATISLEKIVDVIGDDVADAWLLLDVLAEETRGAAIDAEHFEGNVVPCAQHQCTVGLCVIHRIDVGRARADGMRDDRGPVDFERLRIPIEEHFDLHVASARGRLRIQGGDEISGFTGRNDCAVKSGRGGALAARLDRDDLHRLRSKVGQ
tara:strand:- start:142 stop:621 length:480 start_codon:yes stop_codon:yes gene_type:complete